LPGLGAISERFPEQRARLPYEFGSGADGAMTARVAIYARVSTINSLLNNLGFRVFPSTF
jgi:hypothetical protein